MDVFVPVLVLALALSVKYALIQREILKECHKEISQLKEDREKLLAAANDGGFWPDVSMERALGRDAT